LEHAYAKAVAEKNLLSPDSGRQLLAVETAAALDPLIREELLKRAVVRCSSLDARTRAQELLAKGPDAGATVERVDPPGRHISRAVDDVPNKHRNVAHGPSSQAAGEASWQQAAARLRKERSVEIAADIGALRTAPLQDRLEALGAMMQCRQTAYQSAAVEEALRLKSGHRLLEVATPHLEPGLQRKVVSHLVQVHYPRSAALALRVAPGPEVLLVHLRKHRDCAHSVPDGELANAYRAGSASGIALAYLLTRRAPFSYPGTLRVMFCSGVVADREHAAGSLSSDPLTLWPVIASCLRDQPSVGKELLAQSCARGFEKDQARSLWAVDRMSLDDVSAFESVIVKSKHPWLILLLAFHVGWRADRGPVLGVARLVDAKSLLRFVRVDGSGEAVECAVAARPGLPPVFLESLLDHPSHKVVTAALRHLKVSEITHDGIERLLANPSAELRRFGVRVIESRDVAPWASRLLGLAVLDQSPDVRAEATTAVSKAIPTHGDRETLRKYVESGVHASRANLTEVVIAWRDQGALSLMVNRAHEFETQLWVVANSGDSALALQASAALESLKRLREADRNAPAGPPQRERPDWLDPTKVWQDN